MLIIEPSSKDYFNMSYDIYEDTKKKKSLDHIEMVEAIGLGYQAFLCFWVKVIPDGE